MSRLLCLVSALVLALVLPSRAAAEPLTVSSGRIVFTNEPGEFLVAGSGFSFLGSWIPRPVSGPSWSVCWPCQPGAIVDFGSSTYAYVNESIGAATINGVTYPALFFDAELTFHGPRVVASEVHAYPWPSGSFTLTGRIAGFATEDLSGPSLFSVDLTGAGTAGVRFSPLTVESRDSLYLTDVEYEFEDQAPVPEPSTVLLLATGLAVAATRRRGTRPAPSRIRWLPSMCPSFATRLYCANTGTGLHSCESRRGGYVDRSGDPAAEPLRTAPVGVAALRVRRRTSIAAPAPKSTSVPGSGTGAGGSNM